MSDDDIKHPGDALLDEKSMKRAMELADELVIQFHGYKRSEIVQALMNAVFTLCQSVAEGETDPGLGHRFAEVMFMWQRSLSTGDAMNFWNRLEELMDPDRNETIN